MAKPSTVALTKKEQKSVLSAFKTTKSARKIAENLKMSRYQVMAFLDSQSLTHYSEGSYL